MKNIEFYRFLISLAKDLNRFYKKNLNKSFKAFNKGKGSNYDPVTVADKKFELGDSRIVVLALLKDNKSKHVVGGGDDELFSDDNNISVVDIQRQEKLYSIINHTITNDTDLDSLVTDLPVRPMIEALQEQYSSDEWKKLSLDEKNRLIVNIQKELEQLENNDGMDNLFENAEGLGEGLGEEEEPGEEEPGEQEIEFN